MNSNVYPDRSLVIVSVLAVLLLFDSGLGAQPGKEIKMEQWNDLEILQEDNPIECRVELNDEQWRQRLSPLEYHILRERGTERAFSGKYDKFYQEGTYYSAATGQPLFHSSTKFNSGSGWPSFYMPIDAAAVVLREDNTLYGKRVEVLDSSSGSHLGHIFPDGPEPTGLRYCINSSTLLFVPQGGELPEIVLEYQREHGK